MLVLGGVLVLTLFTPVAWCVQSPTTALNETCLNRTNQQSWHPYVIRCGFQELTPKRHSSTRDWTTWSKHANRFEFNNEHDWGEPIRPRNDTQESSLWSCLIDSVWILKFHEANGYGTRFGYANHLALISGVFSYPMRSGRRAKRIHLRHVYIKLESFGYKACVGKSKDCNKRSPKHSQN